MNKEQALANIMEKVGELANVNSTLLYNLEVHETREDWMELNKMVASAEKELIDTINTELK